MQTMSFMPSTYRLILPHTEHTFQKIHNNMNRSQLIVATEAIVECWKGQLSARAFVQSAKPRITTWSLEDKIWWNAFGVQLAHESTLHGKTYVFYNETNVEKVHAKIVFSRKVFLSMFKCLAESNSFKIFISICMIMNNYESRKPAKAVIFENYNQFFS